MDVQGPEAATKRLVLFRAEALVTEHQHMMLGECRPDRLEHAFFVQISGEVNVQNLGPDRRGQRLYSHAVQRS